MAVPKRIWIDLDNTPHVPFFLPIIRALEREGHSVIVTARDAFQVCSLAAYHGLEFQTVGRHYGANRVMKVAGTLWRAAPTDSDRAARAAAHRDVARVPITGVGVVSARHPQHAHFRLRTRDAPAIREARARRRAGLDRRSRVGERIQVRSSHLRGAEGGCIRGGVHSGPDDPERARHCSRARSW